MDVSISGRGHIFTVVRVNSSMNFAGHGARSEEASQIALLVSNCLNAKTPSNIIRIIQVAYLSRRTGSRDRIIDMVEFKYEPAGVFEFHRI